MFQLNFIDIASQFLLLVAGDLDKYTTEKSFIEVDGKFQVSLFTPAHVQFAKYGRGPGKKPPLDPIRDWISKKGIIFEELGRDGTAFAIQNSIAKKGTKNWVPNAPNAIEEAVNNHFRSYSETLAALISVEVSREVNEIVEENIPDQEFKM